MTNFGFHIYSCPSLFGTVTLKSMSNCSKVYISLIIGFIFVSVNNFCCTNLTCQYYLEVGGCIWLWPSRTWVITCLLLCCSSFNTSINLQMEGWCTTISFEICFTSLPLWCLSFNHPSVLICKHCRFLVDILELLVFCLCYAFLRHTLSQHNPLGHLIFSAVSTVYLRALSTSSKGTSGSPNNMDAVMCVTFCCHILMC